MRIKVTEKSDMKAKLAAEDIQAQINKRNQMLSLLKSPEVSRFWDLFVEEDVNVRLENLSAERATKYKSMTQPEFIANAALEAIMKTYQVYPKSVEAARD